MIHLLGYWVSDLVLEIGFGPKPAEIRNFDPFHLLRGPPALWSPHNVVGPWTMAAAVRDVRPLHKHFFPTAENRSHKKTIFINPRSNLGLPLSLANSLTNLVLIFSCTCALLTGNHLLAQLNISWGYVNDFAYFYNNSRDRLPFGF